MSADVTALPALQVRGLRIRYHNGPLAVRDADLDVHAGRITSLVGPNGAGKSTFLQGIAGVERRSPAQILGGSVRLGEREIVGTPVEAVSAAGIAFIPDRGKVFTDLTVREHLTLATGRIPAARRTSVRDGVLDTFPRVRSWLDRYGGGLSGGERQLVAMATALCREPVVLMVDEMSQGLSPAAVELVGQALLDLRGRGIAIVLVEQTRAVAERFADTIHAFERGRCAPAADLREAR